MIQKARCGCVGIPIDEETFICLLPCDNPIDKAGEYSIWKRPINKEQLPFTPLSQDEADKIWDELSALVADGYALREARRILK